ncbi:hypothetical protein J0695_15930, partial [Streptomyces beijiangensis]|nr:hypothetical protein [Streptomyces beijiangensis]
RGGKRSVLAAVVVFVMAMGGITGFELLSGQDLSGGKGRTMGGAVTGDSGKKSTPSSLTPADTTIPSPAHSGSGEGQSPSPDPAKSGDSTPDPSPSPSASDGSSPTPTPTPTPSDSSGTGTGDGSSQQENGQSGTGSTSEGSAGQ